MAAAALVAPAANSRPAATFTSKLYGYSLGLPSPSSRWDVRFAIVKWSGGSLGGIGTPNLDTFTDNRTQRSFLIAARPHVTDLGKWTRVVTAGRPSVCGTSHTVGRSTLGGAPGKLVTWSCSDGYRVFAIAAIHRGRGYFLLAASPKGLSRAADLQALNAARRAFRFARP